MNCPITILKSMPQFESMEYLMTFDLLSVSRSFRYTDLYLNTYDLL